MHGRRWTASCISGAGNYSKELSIPLTTLSCSRISAHLDWRTISIRETVHATRRRMVAAPEWKRSLRAFDARLHWRRHFMQKMEDEPQIEFRNFVTAFDGMREPHWNDDYFAAWCEGRTGYGMVDAYGSTGQTGGISGPAVHRLRARRHYPQFQMQSGTTGINTLRIYSPKQQAEDHDPDGATCPALVAARR